MGPPRSAPRVSVILPTYDRARTLERAMRSVLDQSVRDLELIVVDDASKDGTAGILERLQAEDPRVRPILQPANGGAAAARNAGLAEARGEYVAFQDSDDVWLPGHLEAKVPLLDADPGVGIVHSFMERRRDGVTRLVPDPASPRLEGDLSVELLRRNLLGTPTIVVRRSLLEATGPFDTSLRQLEDWDLWIRASALARVAFVAKPLVHSEYQADSLSLDLPGYITALEHVVDKHRPRFDAVPRILAWHADRIGARRASQGRMPEARKWSALAWRLDRRRVVAGLRARAPAAVAARLTRVPLP
jgi:glycosyltransferase involved in cell wall biosynthesis